MDDNTKSLIQNHIESNEVCLFMKGTPDAPQCGFSMAVSKIGRAHVRTPVTEKSRMPSSA